jgi:hypothetical protein
MNVCVAFVQYALLGSANFLTPRPEIQLKAISKLNSDENKCSNSTASVFYHKMSET